MSSDKCDHCANYTNDCRNTLERLELLLAEESKACRREFEINCKNFEED